MKKLSFKVEGKKLKCGCFFTKDGFFRISDKCVTHREDVENHRPFTGLER
jgi:hypothetical protein